MYARTHSYVERKREREREREGVGGGGGESGLDENAKRECRHARTHNTRLVASVLSHIHTRCLGEQKS